MITLTPAQKSFFNTYADIYGYKTQNWSILTYLSTGNRLNQSDAANWWGVQRLSARISEIKKDMDLFAINITSKLTVVDGKRFTSYRMEA